MTDPHYLKQEDYLRHILRDFLNFLRVDDDSEAVERFIKQDPRSVCVVIPDGKGNVLAVSRRNEFDNLALPGGKLDALEQTLEAVERETKEETGVVVTNPILFFRRVDPTDGRVCACYFALNWKGKPHQREDGILVKWVPFARLFEPGCTFAEYNRATLKILFNDKIFARYLGDLKGFVP